MLLQYSGVLYCIDCHWSLLHKATFPLLEDFNTRPIVSLTVALWYIGDVCDQYTKSYEYLSPKPSIGSYLNLALPWISRVDDEKNLNLKEVPFHMAYINKSEHCRMSNQTLVYTVNALSCISCSCNLIHQSWDISVQGRDIL